MQSWEVEARESIRDLVARYNAQGDAGRIEELMALFCEAAELEIAGEPGACHRGRAAIRTFFTSVVTTSGETGPIRHFTATLQIDLIDAQRGRGRCYFQVLTAAGLDHWGRYLDEYLREGEVWRFLRRRVEVEGAVRGGWADTRPGG